MSGKLNVKISLILNKKEIMSRMCEAVKLPVFAMWICDYSIIFLIRVLQIDNSYFKPIVFMYKLYK